MTNAERLKEIESEYDLKPDVKSVRDMSWLISRVRALEKENFKLRTDLSSSWHISRIEPLVARVKRLSEDMRKIKMECFSVTPDQYKANLMAAIDVCYAIARTALEQDDGA